MGNEADKKLEEARTALGVAYRALHAIVVDRCTGHDNFDDITQAGIRHVFLEVQTMILNPPIRDLEP